MYARGSNARMAECISCFLKTDIIYALQATIKLHTEQSGTNDAEYYGRFCNEL